ncbi:hypothetical protein C6P40_004530, partial [Pichia californica]
QYDTIDVIDTKSQISLDDIGKGSRFIWNSFKRSADPIPLEQFKERFLQSRKVENMKENEYAVLKFGQFKDVYPFLKSMNQVKEGWVAIAKFKNYIYRCNFVCPWKGDTLCTRSCLIIMNTLHQTIFIQYKGSHDLDYDKNNKELCYPAFRNLYLVKWKRSRCPFRDLRRRYKDIYREYVCALGVTPTASTILRWLSSVNKGNFLDSGIRTDDVHDYNKSSEIMLIPDIIMEYIKYTGLQGFIYSSKKSLKEMMKADVISVDATFNMLEDSEVKFITVSFKKELPDGSNPGVFLGCIATLRGGESSRNYTHFFLNLRALILKVFGPGAKSNAKTILTDESQAELTGISRAFDGSVTVRNCVWHKRLTFERNLDVKDVTFAVKALYATTEIECDLNSDETDDSDDQIEEGSDFERDRDLERMNYSS